MGQSAVAEKDSSWQPSLTFFRRGQCDFKDQLSHRTQSVSWHFKRINEETALISHISCEMSCFGKKASGYGYGISLIKCMRQAFAEAWERLWMLRVTSFHPEYAHLSSSNGFAAGRNSVHAIAASRGELIERAMLLSAWQAMRGWRPHKLKSLSGQLIKQYMTSQCWHTKLFTLNNSELGTVLAGLTHHHVYGSVFDTIFCANSESIKVNELKLLNSLRRLSAQTTQSSNLTIEDLPHQGGPFDHHKFYRNPMNSEAFHFLKGGDADAPVPNLRDPQGVVTKLLSSAGTMPAVAVSYHLDWPSLSWGRQSIAGSNPWPHPLA